MMMMYTHLLFDPRLCSLSAQRCRVHSPLRARKTTLLASPPFAVVLAAFCMRLSDFNGARNNRHEFGKLRMRTVRCQARALDAVSVLLCTGITLARARIIAQTAQKAASTPLLP
jgi:hypothetical protein